VVITSIDVINGRLWLFLKLMLSVQLFMIMLANCLFSTIVLCLLSIWIAGFNLNFSAHSSLTVVSKSIYFQLLSEKE
jgi:hypothetical protein